MPSRRDWPPNAAKEAPWNLNLAALNAVATRPSTDANPGDIVANAFDVRGSSNVAFQIVPGTTTGTAIIELQWSLDQINFISLGAAYQLTIAAGAPAASAGLVLSPCPPFQVVRVVTVSAATTGTAKVFYALRD